jgi:intracellular multiplication protein IcmK
LTSVVFSDVGGQPWIIKDVRLNRDVFSDGREPNQQNEQAEPTNAMTIEPKGVAVYGNVTVWLKGLSTPVIFMLSAAQEEVDLRVDAKVPGRNPDSGDVEYTSAPNIDVLLTGFLDGVPPKEARRLSVTGLPQTEAWLYQDNLYVRTNAEVQYPAYFSAARSTSGKAVYRFASRQNSVTLLSNGKAVTVFIED